MLNEAPYDLDRKAAEISASSSNYFDKYEYLTGEDLEYKPSVTEQAKFEYSLLGKVFTKGLKKEEDKKEWLFKRLKNIEKKIEDLPNALSEAIKANKNVIITMTLRTVFAGFTETLGNFKKWHHYTLNAVS